ncbi:group-specific protein [Shouchella sp. 1P09AA]|uniref:group-specific protein n=1 Tax=unclassified Shouchella TaxID=2893065 RepID=UPI0039A012C1
MNFYIASSFTNIDSVRALSSSLQNEGYVQTYDWTKNERATSVQQLKAIGEREKQAVQDADAFILLLPGGKGSHVELGLAIASNTKIFIHSLSGYEIDPSTFYYLDTITSVQSTLNELALSIKEWVQQHSSFSNERSRPPLSI